MGDFIRVLPDIVPVIILIALGYLLNKKNFISAKTVTELKKLVLNISLPALLFKAFLEINLQMKYIYIVVIIFLTNLLLLLIGKLFSRIFQIENLYFPLLFTGFAGGVMGIPLFGVAYGVENIDIFGIVDLGQEFYIWFILFPILLNLKDGSSGVKERLLAFLRSPIIIAILIGLIFNLLGYRLLFQTNNFLVGVLKTMNLISQITLPLILITIGYKITFKFEEFYLPLKTIVLRLITLMILAFFINNFLFNKILGLDPIFNIALLVMFILPPPFSMSLLVDDNKTNQVYVDNMISLEIIFSILAFIIIIFLYD